MTALAKAMPAATAYPRRNPATPPAVKLAAATPDITAAPSEAPSSWNVLSRPEATPA